MQDKGWTDAAGLSMQALKIQNDAEAAKTKKIVQTTTKSGGSGSGLGGALGSAIGGIAGSFIPGVGTAIGATLGGALGGAIDGGGQGALAGGLGGLAQGLSMDATGASGKIKDSLGGVFDTWKGALGFGGISNQNAANKSLLDAGSKDAFNNMYKTGEVYF